MDRRLRLVLAAVLVALAGSSGARAADAPVDPGPTPRAQCGKGSKPETGMQGRVSGPDITGGRAAQGFSCNLAQLGHQGATGGFRVHRYVDGAGHECAYYDGTRLFPTQYLQGGTSGVVVLDMADRANPVQTALLLTPAMLTPHESLNINVERGLLVADMGNPFTYPGFVDVYDLTVDCRHPVLRSSLPVGFLGHEGAFATDGKTFYVTSPAGVLSAVDLSNPSLPVPFFTSFRYRPHGVNISADGNRLYMADIANADASAGLTILDVSEIQRRAPNPQVRTVSHVSWSNVSIPQTAIPVTIAGRRYVVEIDEFERNAYNGYDAGHEVGAARIVDIADDTRPRVVSNIRLEVNMAANRAALAADPNATNALGGYTGHYCAVPQRIEPGIVACTFNNSGLRVFDIRDPRQPKELAYFNPPIVGTGYTETAWALSAPAFVPERSEIWYVDGNHGFFALKFTNGVWPFPATAASAAPT
ncbi:MAG: hypothetical protein H0W70_06655, partial [Actinobacteria bacterium]|nr:hypothetical protein [Actinomycetota bacterium]